MYDLSIVIPARNEMFLSKTIEDILANMEGNTEIIAVLDGCWADPPVQDHPAVTLIHHDESVGQRVATNEAVRISTAKYIMKCDAHCAFDQGFDTKIMDEMHDDWTMAPTMRNLHAFDWICPDGHIRYQGPSGPCTQKIGEAVDASGKKSDVFCNKPTTRKMIWEPRSGTHNSSFCFDREPHFQYNKQFSEHPGYSLGTVIGYDLFFDEPGLSLSVIGLLTNFANSHHLSGCFDHFRKGENMSSDTVGFSSIDDGRGIRSGQVDEIGDQLKMVGITTSSIAADVVKDGNILPPSSGERTDKPGIGNTMGKCFLPEMSAPSISGSICSPLPIPTSGDVINSNIIDELNRILGGKFVYNEKTSRFHNGNVSLSLVYDKSIVATMSLQGSCFMLTREKYWELKICDEQQFSSWGSQGIEVACKTWLSGGQVMVNRKTWYAHMFRTQGGDFGFPYAQSGRAIENNKKKARELFFDGKWDKAIHPLSWLVEKFWPVKNGDTWFWNDKDLENLKKLEGSIAVPVAPVPSVVAVEDKPEIHASPPPAGDIQPTKGIIFYTDNQLPLKLAHAVQKQLRSIGLPIVSASLKPMDNMGKNVYLPLKRGYLTMFKQILAALEATTADIIFFCEHDVFYPKEHFDFTPPKKDVYYYNVNWWKIRLADGYAVSWEAQQVSGLCAYRELLLEHYRKRVAIVEKYGYNHSMGFEPGAHNTIESVKGRDSSLIPKDIYIDDICSEEWKSPVPQVDIKHGRNLSVNKWSLDDFRDRATARNFRVGECPEWAKDIVTKIK
jgi:hypothetical protein